jgi:dehydrogenase/reductase SDR family protein 7
MSKPELHEPAFKSVLKHFGSLDVLVNNAGVAQAGPFEQIELELDRKVFETNVFGPLNLTRLVCTHWLKNELPGHLVLNSSTSAILRNPWSSSYVASKAAISSYLECLEKEYIRLKHPIHTTIVYPGPIDTGIFNRSYRWKVGQSYDKDFVHESEESGVFSWVSAERCAELFAIAIANQVRSCWIARQPILAFTFMAHYMPFLTIPVWQFIMRFKQKALKQLYLN